MKLVVFQGNNMRKTLHDNEWYFSVIDVVKALGASSIPKRYWSDLKSKLNDEGFKLYDKIVQLKLKASDGKYYATDCANTRNMLRIVQSIPSKRAEPFKQWLAKTGYERIQEIEDPELAQQRMVELYRLKGYPENWIEKRVRGIAIRQELTDEWCDRQVEGKDFAILTNEISKATFGKTIKQYKEFKGLSKQNLRDNMTDWELLFTMLGEKATTEITKARDSKGFSECKDSAMLGGEFAGTTRENLEKTLGKSVVSDENFINYDNKKKLI